MRYGGLKKEIMEVWLKETEGGVTDFHLVTCHGIEIGPGKMR
jgi:hypothetical protein